MEVDAPADGTTRPRAAGAGSTAVPTVLLRLFPPPGRVRPLRSALAEMLPSADVAPLLRRGDSVAYRTLLQRALVASAAGAPPLPRLALPPLTAGGGQLAVLQRCAEALRGRGGPPAVLCAGDGPRQTPRQSHDRSYANSAVAALQEEPWETLLTRIGDEAMRHLLQHCAVFAPLSPGGPLLQLSGTSVLAAKTAAAPTPGDAPKQAAAAAAVAAAALGPLRRRADVAARARRRRSRAPSPAAAQGGDGDVIDAEDSSVMATAEASDDAAFAARSADAAPPLLGATGSAPQPRRTRPPSWQRRRAAVAAARAAGALPPPPPRGGASRAAPPSPASQPPSPSPTPAPRSRGLGTGRHHAAVGARLNEIDVTCRSIFYCAPFPRRAGFPLTHPLHPSRGGGGVRAARRLAVQIFRPQLLPPPKPERSKSSKAVPDAGAAAAAAALIKALRGKKAAKRARVRVPRELRPLLPALAAMLRRAARCPFRALLEAHCPLPPALQAAARVRSSAAVGAGSSATATQTQSAPPAVPMHPLGEDNGGYATQPDSSGSDDDDDGASQSHAALLSAHTPARSVAAFAWAVLRRVLPPDLRGGAAGGAALRQLLRRMLSLRRHESLSLHAAMQRAPLRAWPLLAPPPAQRRSPAAQAAAQRRLAKLLLFVMRQLVAPLIRCHFYVTEGEPFKTHVFFFRKPLWARLRAKAMRSLATMYTPLKHARAHVMLRGRTLGVSALRLVPKRQSMRPIVNLSRGCVIHLPALKSLGRGVTARAQAANFAAVNKEMKLTFHALRAETNAHPALFGAGVADYPALYRRIAPFLRAWRAPPQPGGGPPALKRRVFAVAVDISKAFDTVPLPALCALAERILAAPAYAVHRWSSVAPAPQGRVHVRYGKHGAAPSTGVGDPPPPLAAAAPRDAPGAVLVDGAAQEHVARSELVKRLHEHLGANLVRLGTRYLQQHTGIPQGSVLGSVLCSAFYGDMEHVHGLGRAPPASAGGAPPSVLVRWVDDFLFLTVCPDAAAAFVARVHAGFPDYGAAVSAAKTALNFDAVDGDGAPLPRNEVVQPGGPPGARYLRWCGLLLDSATLEARADYSKHEGEMLRDQVAMPRHTPGATLPARLRSYLRPKATALLLDARLNGVAGAALNLHQIFLFAAAKMHVYCAAALRATGRHPAERVLAAAVEDAVRYAQRLLASRLAAAGAPPPPRELRGAAVRFLALRAFQAVLRRKQARYTPLLARIRNALAGRALRAAAQRPELAAAVDPARSRELTSLRY